LAAFQCSPRFIPDHGKKNREDSPLFSNFELEKLRTLTSIFVNVFTRGPCFYARKP